MITDERVFSDDHLPRELEHRESEVRVLADAFQAARKTEERADDVLISGPSGVGKTVLARHTLHRLQEHADVHSAHINCLGSTTGDILRDALQAYPKPTDASRSTPVPELVQELQTTVTQPYILVLDESDDLPATDLPSLISDLPHVSVVVICHDHEEWLARVPDHVRGSIAHHVEADRYSLDELTDILRSRADQGLQAGAVTTDQLEWIADEVVGVARHGIQSLRAAAELATERHDQGTIRDADVDDCFERAHARIRASNLRSLPYHHQVLYAILHRDGPLLAPELHERYDDLTDDLYHGHALTPVGRRSRRNKLAKLVEYDLLEYEGPDQRRTYAVTDESITPRVNLLIER